MPSPILALQAEPELDLPAFCRELWKQKVVHRVVTQEGQRLVLVSSPAQAKQVRELHAQWLSGGLSGTGTSLPARQWLGYLVNYPVLSAVVAIALLCYPATWLLEEHQLSAALSAMSMVPVAEVSGHLEFGGLAEVLAQGQIWRLVSPVFLHFSLMHLLFNLAIVVEFGRRVEGGLGSPGFLFLFLLLAVSSNLAQFVIQGAGLFGGLSGVAYGLAGFVVVMQRFQVTQPFWDYQRPLTASLLIFLVVFSTGITESFGLYIANAAHWAGLIDGCLLAVLVGLRRSG